MMGKARPKAPIAGSAEVLTGYISPRSVLSRDLRGDVGWLIRVLPLDQGGQTVTVWGEQGLDALGVHVRHNDVANLVVDVAVQAVRLHLLSLVTVVISRADVVDRPDLVAVDQKQVSQRHQALLAQGDLEGVLI